MPGNKGHLRPGRPCYDPCQSIILIESLQPSDTYDMVSAFFRTASDVRSCLLLSVPKEACCSQSCATLMQLGILASKTGLQEVLGVSSVVRACVRARARARARALALARARAHARACACACVRGCVGAW
eukprot:6464152-Amphidinium_carterae.2